MSRREAVLFQRRILHAILMICAVVLLAPHCVRAQQNYAVITQNGIPMKTRDGVTLYSDIYRPRADGKCRSEEHTSELQSHRDLHSFPTRRSSDLAAKLRRDHPEWHPYENA